MSAATRVISSTGFRNRPDVTQPTTRLRRKRVMRANRVKRATSLRMTSLKTDSIIRIS